MKGSKCLHTFSLEELADRLAAHLWCTQEALCCQLLQIIIREGQPLTPQRLAMNLQINQTELNAQLAQVPDTEFDEQGNIVGWGVTLVPTSHHFQICGQQMFTWCAFDTVLFPPSLHVEAEVHSVCANTGSPISFTITSEGEMKNLFPPETCLSLIVPAQRDACIRDTFCQQSLFFQSEQAASSWLVQHPEAVLLSVKDAATIGKAIARRWPVQSG